MRCVVQFVYGRNKLFKPLCSFSTSNIQAEQIEIVSLCITAPSWSKWRIAGVCAKHQHKMAK